MNVYILVCVGKGKNDYNGKPIAATFGVYKTIREANEELERRKALTGANAINHFASDEEWVICCDTLY